MPEKIATQILQKSADYLLSVKDNQPALAHAFEAAFPMAKVASFERDPMSRMRRTVAGKRPDTVLSAMLLKNFKSLAMNG